MKSIGKVLITVVALLALAVSFLVACGDGDNGGEDNEEVTVKATELQIRYDGGKDRYFVGESVNTNRIVITATLENGTKKTFVAGKEEGCTVEPAVFAKDDDKVTVTYGGISVSFAVEVINGYIVEAENIKNSTDVTDDDKNYVELIKNTGTSSATTTGISPGPVRKETEPASDGAYLGEIQKGAVFAFHIWSDVEREMDIILRASSGLLQQDNNWTPIVMGDMQFNRLFDVTYSNSEVASQPVNIGDDVILEGGSTDDPNGDPLLWVSWKDVTFGSVTLKPGDNVFTFTVTSDYTNCRGSSCAANVDRMEVRFKD